MKQINLFFLATLFLLLGCSTSPESQLTVIEYPLELQDAQDFLAHKNSERAEHEIQKYLTTTQDVYWLGHAYLLLGEVRENTGRENLAVEAYRKAVKHGMGYNSAVAAQGLYRMSWIYERTLQYNDLQIVLLDLLNVLGDGDNFIKWVETPARLANVYYILGKWDKALKEKEKITSDVFNRYKSVAKDEKNLFQARLYMAFQGMKPITTTPYKSQQIISDSRQELLEVAEMANEQMARRAIEVLEGEYKRYLTQLSQFESVENPVQLQEQNRKKISDLAVFVDEINELRVLRRPPELIANKEMNIEFFRRMDTLEQQARYLVHSLEYGIQKALSKNNPLEKPENVKKVLKPTNKTL